MFSERNIEFSIHPDLIDIKNIQPIPTKKSLPDWYKKIQKHTIHSHNLKGCMPFLDVISAGYLLPLPQDLYIGHNILNKTVEPPQKTCIYKFGFSENISSDRCSMYNLNGQIGQDHHVDQIGGENTFLAKKNGNNNIIKILNPWRIKTPPGYSCLFISPTYNENDYFDIISAIVDTDTFDLPVNFPLIVNNDKYDTFEKVFKQGTPYVQIIPFKRNSWSHKIISKKENIKFRLGYFGKVIDKYKNKIWNRKVWK
jgi:hypothetical protein